MHFICIYWGAHHWHWDRQIVLDLHRTMSLRGKNHGGKVWCRRVIYLNGFLKYVPDFWPLPLYETKFHRILLWLCGRERNYFVGLSLVLEALTLVYKFLIFIELFSLPFFLLFLNPIMNVMSGTSTLWFQFVEWRVNVWL